MAVSMQQQLPWAARAPRGGLIALPAASAAATARRRLAACPPQRPQPLQWQQPQPQQQWGQQQGQQCMRLQPCRSVFDQAWGASLDLQTIWDTLPQNLFAISLFPYLGFLYHLTRSKQTPPLALFGFFFLLVFVFGTIPAGIYAKSVYGEPLANVDWLHGGAESLLTLTNLFIVLGMRDAIRKAEAANAAKAKAAGGAPGGERQPAAPREE